MRKRHALAAMLTTAVSLAVPGTAAVAAPAASSDVVTVSGGTLAPDGTVTLTGTYRCARGDGNVLIGSNLSQNGRSDSIGGSQATCDGRQHTWTNTGKPDTDATGTASVAGYHAGPAKAAATLLSLNPGTDGVPDAKSLTSANWRPITLTEQR